MKKSGMVALIAISTCILIAVVPMSMVSAHNGSAGASTSSGTSLAGAVLSAEAANISEDIVSVSENEDTTLDETPETKDKTPIYIISLVATISFLGMATIGVKEFM